MCIRLSTTQNKCYDECVYVKMCTKLIHNGRWWWWCVGNMQIDSIRLSFSYMCVVYIINWIDILWCVSINISKKSQCTQLTAYTISTNEFKLESVMINWIAATLKTLESYAIRPTDAMHRFILCSKMLCPLSFGMQYFNKRLLHNFCWTILIQWQWIIIYTCLFSPFSKILCQRTNF